MPSLRAQLVERLTARHLAVQGRLLDVVAAQLQAQLVKLPDLSDEALELYVAAAAATVAAGQRQSATLAAGYAQSLAPTRADQQPIELGLDELVVTTATAWVASPIIVARRELANGASWTAALELAASKAKGYTAGDLAVAQRHGVEAGARAAGAPLRGYRKVPAGGACSWCLEVARSRVYRSASSVPFHEHDACSVAPVFAGDD